MKASGEIRYEKEQGFKVYSRKTLGHCFFSNICVIIAAIADLLKFFVTQVGWLSVFVVTIEYLAFALFFAIEELSNEISIVDLFRKYSLEKIGSLPNFFLILLPAIIIFWSFFLSFHEFSLTCSIFISVIEYVLIAAYLLLQCIVIRVGMPMIDDLLLVKKDWC